MGTGSIVGYEEKLAAAMRGFRVLFLKYLQTGDPLALIRLIAMMNEDSTGPEEQYNWLGNVPMMEEHTGVRKLRKLRAEAYILKNKPWANGIYVDLDDIADDKLSIYAPQIEMLAFGFGRLARKLMRTLLLNAFVAGTYACYDGEAFCSDAHPADGSEGAQDNKLALALNTTNFRSACAMLRSFKDEDGEPLDMAATHLFVGENNEGPALEITKGGLIAIPVADGGGMKTNVEAMRNVQPEIISGLGNYWFVMDLSKPLKPMIYQVRDKGTTQAVTSPNSDSVFDTNKAKFGARCRMNMGWGFWQCCVGSTG